METIAIKSRIIVAMQYDKAQQHLSLEFRNGERRLFAGVPRNVVMKMARATSPGEYYIANVRAQFTRIAT
ncbi:KTSC domain-containing protein [Rhizobium tubonense]|uniref:KTSC domain-containing protein n=1 Tax=Rhizobium tubonense TaxID=484088 RepID=A0A2W4CVI9_9HYPH|nr:KTSC domain-containing protein [Rhizobium tubonense]PZM09464.1 KTSC domain-containing protein [Rhizobium tubonense]